MAKFKSVMVGIVKTILKEPKLLKSFFFLMFVVLLNALLSKNYDLL